MIDDQEVVAPVEPVEEPAEVETADEVAMPEAPAEVTAE